MQEVSNNSHERQVHGGRSSQVREAVRVGHTANGSDVTQTPGPGAGPPPIPETPSIFLTAPSSFGQNFLSFRIFSIRSLLIVLKADVWPGLVGGKGEMLWEEDEKVPCQPVQS